MALEVFSKATDAAWLEIGPCNYGINSRLTMSSVLPPPPPRYTVPVAYAAGTQNGMPVPVVETNNIISHPKDGCSLLVGEGALLNRSSLYLEPRC